MCAPPCCSVAQPAITTWYCGAGPSLIFLDEPTSGLDSFAAWSVMRVMQQLAHGVGHTILASIHQPRADIWAMCDQVSA
jgi:ABC-type multidrug transport system ATPase subunit